MIMMTIILNVQKYQEAKPTSGQLKLIRSKKIKKTTNDKIKKMKSGQRKKCAKSIMLNL